MAPASPRGSAITSSNNSQYLQPPVGIEPILAPPLRAIPAPPPTSASTSDAQRSSPLSSLFTFRQRFKRTVDSKRGVKPSDPLYGAKWLSCAVVGNGGVLLGRKRGAEIDGHDAVIRINNAPLKGAEADVGTRTTMSIMNGHIMTGCLSNTSCPCFPYGANVPVIVYSCVPTHHADIIRCRRFNPRATIFEVDEGLKSICQGVVREYSYEPYRVSVNMVRSWHLSHPVPLHFSTGMLSVVLSLAVCDRVSLYGFGSGGGQHHYFPSAKSKEIPDHDYPAEMRFYRHLMEGNVTKIPLLGESNYELPQVTFAMVNQVSTPLPSLRV